VRVYNEQITLQSKKSREVFNAVKAALEKSGFRKGLMEVAPVRSDCKHSSQFQGNSAYRFQNLRLHDQVVVGFSEARLDLDSGQSVPYIEPDGLRPKRISVKVMGA
jgi:thiamine phosphate synthase YjbQ (UPF0047 family)